MKPTDYCPTESEARAIVGEWVQAAATFSLRFQQITTLLGNYQRQPLGRDGRNRVQRLAQLRQQMSNTLQTLATDITPMMAARQPDKIMPSRPGKLQSHARLLRELTELAEMELIAGTIRPVATA